MLTRSRFLAVLLLCAPLAEPQAQTGQWVPTDSALIPGLQWRSVGPLSSGRSTAISGSVQRPNEYYKGTTGGGVFKTEDGGETWNPITDDYFGGTIGAIAVAPSNPDIVYVGGGESPIRGNLSHGEGVWKSTDAGRTWSYLGLKETQHISRIRVHPTNPDVVYVGALGPIWGSSPARGVFRSRDGGRTWDKILFRNDSTGVSDLILDPSNPDIIYASLWEMWRRPWTLNSGGPGSGIFKTENGGNSWREITRATGLPRGIMGNIGLAVSPAKPSRVWAIIENDSGGVYRSDDAGRTWKFLNNDRNLLQRAWYYTRIYADPADTNLVHVLNVAPWTSRDGGETFGRGFGGGDNHDMWIDPTNGQRMAVVHDHGVNITTDGGNTNTSTSLATGQFYHVHLTNHVPFHICGAQQDANSVCLPSQGDDGVNGAGRAYGVAGGESGYIATKPDDPEVSYGGNYGGNTQMRNRRTGESRRIDAWPLNPMGHPAEDLKYRFQWTFPIVTSPHDPNVLYVTSNVVHRTRNEGLNWEIISPDLTRADPRTLGNSGGPITKDQTSVEYYATIFAFAESQVTAGVLWAGSDDGRIHVSRDNGASWRNVTPPDLPEWTRVSIVEPSPHDAATMYFAGNRYQLLDFEPYLYRTTDYGATWTRIDAGIERTQFTRAIREDPQYRGMLYAATERGVWFSRNNGANWEKLQLNLPPVPVHDLAIKNNSLVAATHGRGFYIIDDLTMLQQAQRNAMLQDAFLYKPNPAYMGVNGGAVTVNYRLNRPDLAPEFQITDPRGEVVGTATAASAPPATGGGGAGRGGGGRGAGGGRGGRAGGGGGGRGGRGGGGAARPANDVGLNSFNMSMSYPGAERFSGMVLWSGALGGPNPAPGTYTITMKLAGQADQSHTFELRRDPRIWGVTDAELVEKFNFQVRVRDKITESHNVVRTVRNVKYQLNDREGQLRGGSLTQFRRLAAQLTDSMSAAEEAIYQVRNQSGQDPLNYPIMLSNQLAALNGFISSSGAYRVPQQAYDVWNELAPPTDAAIARANRVIGNMLPAINQLLRGAGLPEIVPSTEELGVGGGRGGGRGAGRGGTVTELPQEAGPARARGAGSRVRIPGVR